MISLSTYSMIDGMFVGKKLGKEAIAAVNIAWPIFPGLIAYELLLVLGQRVLWGIFWVKIKPIGLGLCLAACFILSL